MSGYDLGMVHSLLGDISGQLRDILRDCSCSGSSDLSVELLGAHSSDYLTQQLFSCTQLLSKCESVLQISSVEISRIKDTVISLQDEKLKASQGGESVISATPQVTAGYCRCSSRRLHKFASSLLRLRQFKGIVAIRML